MATYAAYGSNMDPAQMADRCPHSPQRGTGWLVGWRLTFGGADIGWEGALTTVVEDSAERVFVALYDLSEFDDGRFDVVFASNLVEHLDRDAADRLVDESHRVLAPGGRLILLQPNFRLAPGRYFDDYTHVSIWTDQSLGDFLRSRGWVVEAVFPRFLPLTLKSRGAGLTFLVPWYLRSPVKPMAGQMLLVARR